MLPLRHRRFFSAVDFRVCPYHQRHGIADYLLRRRTYLSVIQAFLGYADLDVARTTP